MAYDRRQIVGAAVLAKLTADITNTSNAISIDNVTGWPTGGANGNFVITIDRGKSTEEKVLCSSRSGNTLNVATGGRGYDGTSPAAHSGSTVEVTLSAVDLDEANYAVNQTVGKVTTKGDSLWATAPNTFGRLAVGADGLPVVADSTQAAGVKWAALGSTGIAAGAVGTSQLASGAYGGAPSDDAASGSAGTAATISRSDHAHGVGMQRIQTISLSSATASVTFSSIPTSWSGLMLTWYARTDRASNTLDLIGLRFNGDTGSNYNWQITASAGTGNVNSFGTNESSIALADATAASADSGTFGGGTATFPNYNVSGSHKVVVATGGALPATSSADFRAEQCLGRWANATAGVTSITLLSRSGANFISGSVFTLYGLR